MHHARQLADNPTLERFTELETIRKVIYEKTKILNALAIELAHLKQREKELKNSGLF